VLRDWLGEPSAFTRIQCEPVVRLLGAAYADPDALVRSLAALREPLEQAYAALESSGARACELPHRESVIAINHRFACASSMRTRRGWMRPRPSSGVHEPGEDDRVERRRLVELLLGLDGVREQGIRGADLEDEVGEVGQQIAAGRVGRGEVERRAHEPMVGARGAGHKRLRQAAHMCR